jgi:hypothetical protein
VDLRPNKDRPIFGDNLPPNTTKKQISEFLALNWDSLAAFSYEGYLLQGRGLILLDWDNSLNKALDLIEINNSLTVELQCFYSPSIYLGERSELTQAMRQDEGFAKLFDYFINRYVPETSVTFVLVWGVTSDRSGGEYEPFTVAIYNAETPVELYKRQRSRQSEFEVGPSRSEARQETYDEFVKKYMLWNRENHDVLEPPESNADQHRFLADHQFQLMISYTYYYNHHSERGVVLVLRMPDGHWGTYYLPERDFDMVLDGWQSPETQIAEFLNSFDREHGFVCVLYYADSGVYRSFSFEILGGVNAGPPMPKEFDIDRHLPVQPSLDVLHMRRLLAEQCKKHRKTNV